MDAAAEFHPVVSLVYFGLVLGFTLALGHPLCLALSLFSALAYRQCLPKKAGRLLRALVPLAVLTALLNPAFSHQGVTILAYLPSGNPLTAESIAYGLGAGGLLVTILCWFSCFNQVMTTDKFVYLFGRALPGLAMLLSLSLGFLPRFRNRLQRIWEGQRALGRSWQNAGFLAKARLLALVLSGLIGWALESAMETADSMKSRGYGLSGRTSFSLYVWRRRDLVAIAFLAGCAGVVAKAAWQGALDWQYYPYIRGAEGGWGTMGALGVFFLMCFWPVIWNRWEALRWKRLQSNI